MVLTSGAATLQHIIRWRIANGTTIKVMDQVWIGDTALSKRPLLADTSNLEDKHVSDLLQEDGNWNLDVLHQLFHPSLVERIIAIDKLPPHQEDTPELCKIPLGRSITSMAYDMLFPTTEDDQQWLYKLKLHARERLFWWRMLHDAIPTYSWLHHRGLKEEVLCPWGCAQEEDIPHITIFCSLTCAVLQVLARWGFTLPTFHSWNDILVALKSTKRTNSNWARLYCHTIYQVWRTRNAKVHGRSHATPTIIAATVLEAFIHSTAFTFQEHWENIRPSGLIRPSSWSPPPPGWLKVNVDGALLPTNEATIGAVLRDERGDFIAALGQRLTHWDSTFVELQAMLSIKQLFQPWMYELRGIIIEGDNSNVVDFMRKTMEQTIWQNRPNWSPDIGFLTVFHQVIFNHTPRECNKLADLCTRIARQHDFVWFQNECIHLPPIFLSVLEEDKCRVVTS